MRGVLQRLLRSKGGLIGACLLATFVVLVAAAPIAAAAVADPGRPARADVAADPRSDVARLSASARDGPTSAATY